MGFAATLIVTAGLSLALRDIVKKYAPAFYCVAFSLTILFLAGANGVVPGSRWEMLVLPVQRCTVALSLFTVVMFIGVLPQGGALDVRLRPIRSELSITACILCLGHVCRYLVPYAGRAIAGSLAASTAVSFAIAVILFVLLCVLGVTSFGFVKRHVRSQTWKNVQRLSYVFFALVWMHILFMFVPAALNGGGEAFLNVVVYSVVFAVYLVLRIVRLFKERRMLGASQ